jgi:hypothetical protein
MSAAVSFRTSLLMLWRLLKSLAYKVAALAVATAVLVLAAAAAVIILAVFRVFPIMLVRREVDLIRDRRASSERALCKLIDTRRRHM